jgi:hypothetical protein
MTGGLVRRAEFNACLETTVEQWAAGVVGWDVDTPDESEPSVLDGIPMADGSPEVEDKVPDEAEAAADPPSDEPCPYMRDEDDAFPRLPFDDV